MDTSTRKPSIDALRGVAMVLMALDHARDYFAPTPFDPLDVDATTAGWFLTRLVTHFCAPAFVCLAGTAAWYKGRKVGARELSRWLVKRGLWLVLLELVVNNTLWFASVWPAFLLLQVQVLWAIGVSMICLGGLCRLPRAWVAAVAFAMIAGHDLLDRFGVPPPGARGAFDYVWAVLHVQTVVPFQLGDGFGVFVINYPLVPWIGVLAAGWVFGAWFEARANRARSVLALGVGLCLAFVALRALDVYGEPLRWSVSERGAPYTVFSFLNCTKYPPSLAFLLMTLGPALVLLAAFERFRALAVRPLVVFGRVPLFYYLLHIAVLHAGAIALALWNGDPPAWWWNVGPQASPGYEPELWRAYAAWLLVVVALYPVCVAWGRLKARRRGGWIDLL